MKHTTRMHARTPLYLALVISTTAFAAGPVYAQAQAASAASAARVAPASTSASPQASTVNANQTPPNGQANTANPSGQQNPASLQGVTVTGYRQSINSALAQKRRSNAIIEVINAESVSQFPAKDVADALQHLPGVIITRSGGQGKNVSIRGLAPDLTLTQLNGNFVANAQASSAGLTRSFNYLLLPSQMIASVEVYKTQEAQLDAGGIGGNVILHTRRPLQMPANKGFVSVKATSSDTMSKAEPRLSALYSWHTQDDRFGFLVGASYQKRDVRDYFSRADSWHWWANDYDTETPTLVSGQPVPDPENVDLWPGGGVTDQAGKSYSGYWMPQQFSLHNRTERRRRQSAQLTAQFKPSDNFLLTANYFRFQFNNDNTNQVMEIPEWGLPTSPYSNEQGRQLSPGGLTFDPSHTIVTGAQYHLADKGVGCRALTNPVTGEQRDPINVCSEQYPWLTGNYDHQSAKSQSFNLKGEWSAGIISGSFNVGRTWSKGGPTIEFSMAAKPRRFKDGEWQNGNRLAAWSMAGKPSITVSPNVLKNELSGIGQIDLGSTGSGYSTTKMAQNYGQLDFTMTPDWAWVDSLQFGVKYSDTHGSQRSIQDHWFCPGTEERYQQCDPNAGVLMPGFLQSSSLKSHTQAFDANIFPAVDFPAYYAYLNDTYGPATSLGEPQNFGGIREQDEAAYVQLNYDAGPLRGNIGVRWVRILQGANIGTTIETLKQEYYHNAAGDILFCPSSGVNKVGGTCVPGDFQYRPSDVWDIKTVATQHNYRSYTKILPSFNLVYTLPHNIQLRAAWSEAMAPPNYGDLLRTGSITHVTPAYYHDRKQFGARLPGFYGSGGNPALKEFTARQYDLAAAWYPTKGAVLSVDYFHKNVKNFVVPVTIAEQEINVGGQTQTVREFGTVGNGGQGTSKGLEFSGQYTFPFGFGMLANYTINNTSSTNVTVGNEVVGTSKLVGSAKYAGNLSLFYQKGPWLVRASSNWTGPVVEGLVTGLTAYEEPYNQVDLNAHYKFNKQLMVTGSILNLTQSRQRSRIGGDSLTRLDQLMYSGRQYYLGLTYSFGR